LQRVVCELWPCRRQRVRSWPQWRLERAGAGRRRLDADRRRHIGIATFQIMSSFRFAARQEMRMRASDKNAVCRLWIAIASCATLFAHTTTASAQRILGLDVSAYQGDITTTEWATLKRPTNQQVGGVFGDGRDFVIIRSSRGGTTGEDHRQGGYPSGNNTYYTQSERYDDPYFVQNITRATAAGLFAGAYHFARPDVIVGTVNSDGSTVTVANTGTDEADHFMQMAGPWMRPGYLPPMYDFEAGQSQRT